jgi:hypothetical protein
MTKHDVGTRRSGNDGPDNNPIWDANGFDTPTLIEVWRTAPYLHLGSAMTVKDAILAHVNTTQLSSQQIDRLAAYVMQIGPTRENTAPVPVVADAGAPTPDAPSGSIGADGGVPMASDAPMAPDAPGGSTGGTAGSGGPASTGGAGGSTGGGTGGSSAVSSGSAGPGGTGGSSVAQPAVRGDASAQGSVTLTRGGLSCHVGSASLSPDGSVLLLFGLAWLARRARGRAKTHRRTDHRAHQS